MGDKWLNAKFDKDMNSTKLPLYLEKPGIWEILKKKTRKNLEFSTTFSYIVVKFQFETKVLSYF